MSYSEWIIIGLICLGVLAIIIALIWTKLIKPNTFVYTSNNFIDKSNRKKIFTELVDDSVLTKYLANVSIKSNNISTYSINEILISNKCIYLISDALYYETTSVSKEKGVLKARLKKGGYKDMPHNLIMYYDAVKFVKKNLLKNNEVCIITPCLNKNFNEYEIDNINFVKFEKLKEFIKEFDKKETLVKRDDNELKEFEKNISFIKNRFFITKKNVYTKKEKN